ncbi:sulfocyanin [Metallosphaera javensis (ex Sakai et al. 2022)]|uniref:sulfocyanin n=1 Tax=Metallosphaera javensis (ex Sakai et al. 2022) TaxID=2775498 RepID=UPI00258E6216|nr:MAG: sulfocyanin [Metallosphaera javensis (ex Sakai et al. 2022)]
MAKIDTPMVVAIVIAIILVAVAAYYIAVRSTPINVGNVTTTLPAQNVSVSSTSNMTVTTTNTTKTSTNTTSTSTTSTSLPPGATPLPYNSANKTVFLYIVASSSGQPFNFNGTSNGQLHIYIPAGWTVVVHFTNQEGLEHNFLIIQNTTATPGDDVGQDGTIILAAGTTTSNYMNVGISSGQTATASAMIPAGIYWFACGISGHAAAGMWGVLISSSSVTTPYAIQS